MTTLTLDHKYIELLQSFGNIHEVLAEAIKRYALERINERIDLARQNVLAFEVKYGLTYPEFLARIFDDDAWVEQLWQTDPTWEDDKLTWAYYSEMLEDWICRRENILKFTQTNSIK